MPGETLAIVLLAIVGMVEAETISPTGVGIHTMTVTRMHKAETMIITRKAVAKTNRARLALLTSEKVMIMHDEMIETEKMIDETTDEMTGETTGEEMMADAIQIEDAMIAMIAAVTTVMIDEMAAEMITIAETIDAMIAEMMGDAMTEETMEDEMKGVTIATTIAGTIATMTGGMTMMTVEQRSARGRGTIMQKCSPILKNASLSKLTPFETRLRPTFT